MWESVGAIITAAVGGGGGIFGMIGAGISNWFKGKELKRQREHELRVLELKAAAQREQTTQAMSAAAQAAGASAREAAMDWSPAVKGASQWVIDARSMHRPILTYVLIVVATWLVWWSNDPQLTFYGVISVVWLAGSAVGFWFGERALSLPKHKH